MGKISHTYKLQWLLPLFLLLSLSIYSNLSAASGKPPLPVFATKVKYQSVYDEIEALGTLEANERVSLQPTVMERVIKIYFEDGQRVEKGALLLEMESAEEIASVEEEQFRITEAKRQVKRLEPLVKQGASTQSLLDEQRLQVEIYQSRLLAASARLRERRIEAPFSGVLGLRQISVGALVEPGVVVTTLDDDHQMKLNFSVPERFLSSFTVGMPIESRTQVWPDKVFQGKLKVIDTRVNPVTRSIVMRAHIDNQNYQLKSGMLMRVLVRSQPRESLMIPEESLLNRGSQHYIYRLIETENEYYEALQQAVTIGTRMQGNVEILDGLTPGDMIIVDGISKVSSGTQVSIKAFKTGNESVIH